MWQEAIVLGIQMADMLFSLLPWLDGPQGAVAFFSVKACKRATPQLDGALITAVTGLMRGEKTTMVNKFVTLKSPGGPSFFFGFVLFFCPSSFFVFSSHSSLTCPAFLRTQFPGLTWNNRPQ